MKKRQKTKTVDLVRFIDSFAIREDGQPLILEPHQRAILGEAFRFDGQGKLIYSNIIYSTVKKEGKSSIGGLAGIWAGFTLEPPGEVYCNANDLEQSQSKVFAFSRGFVERNPILRREAEITAKEIRFSNGSFIRAIPVDAPSESGSSPTVTIWDELWGYQSEASRRHFEEMSRSPIRKNSIRVIVTYAGWEGESQLLEDYYYRVFNKDGSLKPGVERPLGDDLPVYVMGDLFMYWDHIPRMPWQTKEYLDSQRRDLRLNTYLRLHENRWVSNESSLFDMEEWDGCVDPDHRPPLPNPRLPLFVGCDASVKRDRSAVVSVYRDGDLVCLGPYTTWQPSPKEPMDLEETMEKYIRGLASNYNLVSVRYDPFQLHRSMVTLAKDGIPTEEFPQSVPNLTDIGSTIYGAVKHKTLRLYADVELRKEASFAVGKETPRGMRIVKEKASHKIDAIVALAMAVHAASTRPEAEQPWELPYQPDDRWSQNNPHYQNLSGFIVERKRREVWDIDL